MGVWMFRYTDQGSHEGFQALKGEHEMALTQSRQGIAFFRSARPCDSGEVDGFADSNMCTCTYCIPLWNWSVLEDATETLIEVALAIHEVTRVASPSF